MTQNETNEPDKHYDTQYWQKYADIEHRIVDGTTYEDRIQKEVDLHPGDKVLDLAFLRNPACVSWRMKLVPAYS